MLTRVGVKWVFECDECGDVLETDTDDYDEAIELMKENGWKAEKVFNDWCHHCKECA